LEVNCVRIISPFEPPYGDPPIIIEN
jgi:hypothetical protein